MKTRKQLEKKRNLKEEKRINKKEAESIRRFFSLMSHRNSQMSLEDIDATINLSKIKNET